MKTLLSLLSLLLAVPMSCFGQIREYYDSSRLGADLSLSVDTLALSSVVDLRCALVDDKAVRGDSPYWWSFVWNYADGRNYEYVRVRSRGSDFGDLLDRRAVVVSVGVVADGMDSIVESAEVRKDIGAVRGYLSLALEWRDSALNVYFGSKSLTRIMAVDRKHPVLSDARIMSEGRVDVEYAVVETVPDPAVELASGWDAERLRMRMERPLDDMEGLWTFFDRETDDYRARLGGRYTLACVADGSGGYLLLYIDGAEVNASAWRPLMIKGRLTTTQYENNYDLKWYDSVMSPMSSEDFAVYDEEGLLTLNFPIHRSKIRMSKRPVSRYRF